MKITA